MKILEIIGNKENFLDILLIGDEDINMINRYLSSGRMFALYGKTLQAICLVVEFDNVVEIKNLATYPQYRNQGCASKLIEFVCNKYKNKYKKLILGTGENEITLNFYKKRGFIEYKRVKDFFTENYSYPIFENGVQLKDMIYLKKNL